MTARSWTIYDSPLGQLTLIGGPGGISELRFPGDTGALDRDGCHPAALRDALAQLDQYFAGSRRQFELPLDLGGTPFQLRVWAELAAIPYGQTRSYGQLAEAIGRPGCFRAVGAAVGRTPLPIIIPCHRAVGASGALTGYRGGLHRKRALLAHEHAVIPTRQGGADATPARRTRRPPGSRSDPRAAA